jgi:hypothetical protein
MLAPLPVRFPRVSGEGLQLNHSEGERGHGAEREAAICKRVSAPGLRILVRLSALAIQKNACI